MLPRVVHLPYQHLHTQPPRNCISACCKPVPGPFERLTAVAR